MLNSSFTDYQKGLIAACTTAASWSLLAILLKLALNYSDSFSIVWYRMCVAFVALFLWMMVNKKFSSLKVLLAKPGALLITALCLGINYLGFMKGVELASPASAQIFIQIGPLSLALAGIFVFKEKLSKTQLLGLTACLFGFGLFFLDRMGQPTAQEDFYLGMLWIIFAALTWALFASLLKVLLRTWESSQVNLYIYLVVTLMYFPVVDWSSLQSATAMTHGLFIFLGLNSIIAYGCLSVALKYLPATQVSPIITMNPLLTLVFITIIDHMQWGFIPADPIGWKGYLGALIAIFGVRSVLSKEAGPKS